MTGAHRVHFDDEGKAPPGRHRQHRRESVRPRPKSVLCRTPLMAASATASTTAAIRGPSWRNRIVRTADHCET